ncbi:MAG: hypothetical protein LBJ08_00755 [Bifidobacteriaceae bacterium]|jgi:hypothetical protein|nr:hypothetical protein [Bifidobacteriaceae bacterium]
MLLTASGGPASSLQFSDIMRRVELSRRELRLPRHPTARRDAAAAYKDHAVPRYANWQRKSFLDPDLYAPVETLVGSRSRRAD